MSKIREHNKAAWNRLVDKGNEWTRPVSSEQVAEARKGNLNLLLTPTKFVPKSWYPKLSGASVLCLASGGGQQGPLLSAAGANVVVFDNSPRQLEQDRSVAEREGLKLRTVEGDMRELDAFIDNTFDFIFHRCSNGFVDSIPPVWKEAYRVLKPGGTMVSGFSNPFVFLFDVELERKNILQLKYTMPYSDLASLTQEEREKFYGDEPLSFAHTLEDQIGGQTDAGFHIIGLYEDDFGGKIPLDSYIKGFIATRALKMDRGHSSLI